MDITASDTPIEPIFVSVRETARVLGKGVSTIWGYIKDGRLKTINPGGGKRLVVFSSVKQLAQELIAEAEKNPQTKWRGEDHHRRAIAGSVKTCAALRRRKSKKQRKTRSLGAA
jgi:predicted DNA-binding transcriptional regulator AlpA